MKQRKTIVADLMQSRCGLALCLQLNFHSNIFMRDFVPSNHRSLPPPRPPDQQYSGEEQAQKLLWWPSFQFVISHNCSRELMLAATQPWCRSAFSPGYKEQQKIVWMLSDARQESCQTISNSDTCAYPLNLQEVKSYEEMSTQWDPGINQVILQLIYIVEKLFILVVDDEEMTKG